MDWKKTFSLGQSEIFGLDIGSSAVKMIQLRKEGSSYAVVAAAIANIASGQNDNISQDSVDQKEVNTTMAIRECFDFTRIQTKLVVCSVSGPQVAVRDFKFPLLPSDEIEGAVMLEAAQSCPFNTRDGAVDYQVIPVGENEVGGVLVAATNSILKSKIRQLESASLNCVLMDVDGLALLNCFNACEKRESGRPTSVLNVGSSNTNLAIIGNNNWPFIRDVGYAGNDIIREIAEENSVSTETVRKTLFGDSEEDQLELRKSLGKACEKLTTDVTKTLRYYTAQEKMNLAENIYICGGFALAKGFIEILNSQLPAEAVLWNPFDKMRCNTGHDHRGIMQKNILQKSGSAMAVAAGLAMRSI